MFEKALKVNRVAVFVDGDNLSPNYASKIREIASARGDTFLVRVYANLKGPSGWMGQPGFRGFDAGEGKNAADLLLTVDAMEVAMSGRADHVVIATSDRDFTHLVQRLRERCLRVTVIGESKAPEPLREAGTEFIGLDAADPPRPVAQRILTPLEDLVVECLRKRGGPMSVQQINQAAQIAKQSVAKTGASSWASWLDGRSDLLIFDRKAADGGQVRLKR